MTGYETENTQEPARTPKGDGTFGPLLIGVGLLVVVIDTFLTGGFRPGVTALGGLLVLVGCTERVVGALRATRPLRGSTEARRKAPSDH